MILINKTYSNQKPTLLYIYAVLELFKKHITDSFPFMLQSRLLLAVSGGMDSVVLMHLCKELELDVAMAHCNFNLRGKESDADEAFVLQLGETYNTEVFVESFDTNAYAKQHKLSTQMAARELRYDWFQDLAESLNFDYILTAHHADDNLETFLINFLRGTGLDGLTGIPAFQNNIVRPLLPFSREAIERYLNNSQIVWRDDSSNATTKYLRNKLRHEVVPILKDINPQLLQSFQTTLSHLNDVADIVDESLNAVAKRAIVDIDETGISYKISEFKKVNNPHAYLYYMFKDFGFTAWNDILDLLDAQSGKQVFSETHVLLKHREFLVLSEIKDEKTTEVIEIQNVDGTISTPVGTLIFEMVQQVKEASNNSICIDLEKLEMPLYLRPWKAGDYFYPSGMTGRKKVSKYLKDEKLSLFEKDNIWVLTARDTIVWVVGKRLDNRFKVTSETTKILKISLNS